MFPKFGVIAVLVFIALVGQSNAQDGCVAKPVFSLMLSSNQTLSWIVGADEVCEITEFLLFIWETDGPNEYTFSVKEPSADLSFLTSCQPYVFVVIPVSEHTLGRDSRLVSQFPVPPDADLSIDYFNATTNIMTDETYLHWGWNDDKYVHCALEYRVTIEEEGSPIIDDVYTLNTSLNLHFLSPCSTYQFGVRAINIGRPTVEGPLKLAFYRIPGHTQGPPHLDHVDQGAHFLNLTYRFESKIRNPCPIHTFYIDGRDSFQKTIELDDDAFRRQPVNVTITALRPNSMYFFRAYVGNDAGWSTPNVAAVQTLDD